MSYTKQTISDRVSFFSAPSTLRQPMTKMLHQLQTVDPATLVVALVCFLRVVAEEFELDLGRLLSVSNNIVNDADNPYSVEIKAMRDFLRCEVLGQPYEF